MFWLFGHEACGILAPRLGIEPESPTLEDASKLTLGVKNPTANAGDLREVGLMPGLGRSPGGGHGNPLQNACLEKPMDRGAWRATVHGVTKSWT